MSSDDDYLFEPISLGGPSEKEWAEMEKKRIAAEKQKAAAEDRELAKEKRKLATLKRQLEKEERRLETKQRKLEAERNRKHSQGTRKAPKHAAAEVTIPPNELTQLRSADVKKLIRTWGYDEHSKHSNYELETHNFVSSNGRKLQYYTDPIFRILLRLQVHNIIFQSDADVLGKRPPLSPDPDPELDDLVQRFFQEDGVPKTLAKVKRICQASTYDLLHVIAKAIGKLELIREGNYAAAYSEP